MAKTVNSWAKEKDMAAQKKAEQFVKDKDKAWQESMDRMAKQKALRLAKEAADREKEATPKAKKSASSPNAA